MRLARTVAPAVLLAAALSAGGETAPPLADKVTVAVFDTEPRTPTTKIAVFEGRDAVTGPFHLIARLNLMSKAQDEAQVLNAISYRARQLGATGLILLPPEQPYTKWPASATDQNKRNFRAEAILLEVAPQPTPTAPPPTPNAEPKTKAGGA